MNTGHRYPKLFIIIILVSVALVALLLTACQGPPGEQGLPGPQGETGPSGPAGPVNPASIVARSSGNYGKDIVVYGSGFRPSEVVDIYLGDSRIGTTRASTRGTFWAELAFAPSIERLLVDRLVDEVRAVGNNGSEATYPIEYKTQ